MAAIIATLLFVVGLSGMAWYAAQADYYAHGVMDGD